MPGEERCQVCVLGTGGMGSAALYHLARRGVRAIGLERFQVGHDRGSSHGDTRIIRRAYFEAPDYLPLLDRSYALWRDLERDSGEELMRLPGLLVCGHEGSPTMAGIDRAFGAFPVDHERLEAPAARARFPALAVPDDAVAVLDREGGFLYVERCVRAHARLARAHGATIHEGEEVLGWHADAAGVTVETRARTVRAERLVVTAGAWAKDLLADLGVPFEVLRRVLLWYAAEPRDFGPDRLPCFYVDTTGLAGFEDLEGGFYGFPALAPDGLKCAEHSPGRLGGAERPVSDPLAVERALLPDDEPRVRRFVERWFPGLAAARPLVRTRHGVCMYTMTPDQHFVVDVHPRHANVAVAAGFSGHGFKLATVVGEALADLAIAGSTELPIGFLGARRFGGAA